eukprot:maker-scaffold_38-snap-gene-2.24-mRNA-1 protein AED:0.07 eAED:0.13 QI:0/0/0/1/1/1/2/0/320
MPKQKDTSSPQTCTNRIRWIFHRLNGGFIAILVILFIIATYLEFSEDGDRFEEKLEFIGLLFLVVPIAFLLLCLGTWLFFCFNTGDEKGCFTSPYNPQYHPNDSAALGQKYSTYQAYRFLELTDFLTDVGSVLIIFEDFIPAWRVVLFTSLFLTAMLNLVSLGLFNRRSIFTKLGWTEEKSDKSLFTWKQRKNKIALSIMLLGVEDLIQIPINILYLNEEIDAGALSPLQEKIETAAVILSTVLGLFLFLIRFSRCSLPDDPELFSRYSVESGDNNHALESPPEDIGKVAGLDDLGESIEENVIGSSMNVSNVTKEIPEV